MFIFKHLYKRPQFFFSFFIFSRQVSSTLLIHVLAICFFFFQSLNIIAYFTQAPTHKRKPAYTHAGTHTHTQARIHTRRHACTHGSTQAQSSARMHTHIRFYARTRAYTHIHLHKRTRPRQSHAHTFFYISNMNYNTQFQSDILKIDCPAHESPGFVELLFSKREISMNETTKNDMRVLLYMLHS